MTTETTEKPEGGFPLSDGLGLSVTVDISPDISRLAKFYDVATIPELINAMEKHIERLRKIEAAARKLDEAMTSHKHELLNLTLNSYGWDWAWDMLADALEPNMKLCGERSESERRVRNRRTKI
jgi:hypothetical protein